MVYAETTTLCPVCAQDVKAQYEENHKGMFLKGTCPIDGDFSDMVERDTAHFKRFYEMEFKRELQHLIFPLTYRCNLNCKHCFSLSNSKASLPEDRCTSRIIEMADAFEGNVTFTGGEPTVREDLFTIIRELRKRSPHKKISITTNGQRLSEPSYVSELKTAGISFVNLTLNDESYEKSPIIFNNRLKALENLEKARIPVWLLRTVDSVSQTDSFIELLKEYRRTVFMATLRTAKSYGINYSDTNLYVSDLLKHFGLLDSCRKATSPFNRYVEVDGIKIKFCSWVIDNDRLDPIDSFYYTSDDVLQPSIHGAMRIDEAIIKGKYHKHRKNSIAM